MARQLAAALTPCSLHSPPLGEEPPRPASHAPPDASSPGRDVWPRMAQLPAGADPVPPRGPLSPLAALVSPQRLFRSRMPSRTPRDVRSRLLRLRLAVTAPPGFR